MARKVDVDWHFNNGELSPVCAGLMACVAKYFVDCNGTVEVRDCCAKVLLAKAEFRQIVKNQPKVSLRNSELAVLLDLVLGRMKASDEIFLWGTTNYMNGDVCKKILRTAPGYRMTRKSNAPETTVKRKPTGPPVRVFAR